jgi:hypothetical protein
MRRIWLAALAFLVAGCGIQPSGVTDVSRPPTGVAPGVTLYFVDAQNTLRPDLRPTERLGTISEAMTFLLAGPGGDGLRTQIVSGGMTGVVVTTEPGLIRLRVPLGRYEVTALGIDQIVCTALGVWVQSGGSRTTKVKVTWTTAGPDRPRTCPLIT